MSLAHVSPPDIFIKSSLEGQSSVSEAVVALEYLALQPKGQMLGITVPSSEHARNLASTIQAISSPGGGSHLDKDSAAVPVYAYPARDILPFEEKEESRTLIAERIRTQYLASDKNAVFAKGIFIVPISVLFEKVEKMQSFLSRLLMISQNLSIEQDTIIRFLETQGYVRESRVERVGQYSQHAHIIDVFSPSEVFPIRIEILFGRVQSLRLFDSSTQRSTTSISSINLCPLTHVRVPQGNYNKYLTEALLPMVVAQAEKSNVPTRVVQQQQERLSQGVLWPGLEYFAAAQDVDPGFIMDLHPGIRQWLFIGGLSFRHAVEEWAQVIKREDARRASLSLLFPEASLVFYSKEEVLEMSKEVFSTYLSESSFAKYSDNHTYVEPISSNYLGGVPRSEGLLDQLITSISKKIAEGSRVVLAVSSESKAQVLLNRLVAISVSVRFAEMSVLEAIDSVQPGEAIVVISRLDGGCYVPRRKLLVLSDVELFHVHRQVSGYKPIFRSSPYRRKISSLSQLEVGDFVVHEGYGIGLFRGLKVLDRVEGKGEFLHIEYAEKAQLYVPLQDFLKVGKYFSSSSVSPELSMLGSEKWNQVKSKIQNDVARLTGRLLKAIAARSIISRPSYGDVDDDDRYFAEAFPFQETEDQAKAISSVLEDLASTRPMDRLVCGDVGFGKTEVALRAAFKVAASGKQVVLLAPTTILAEQHSQTFTNRFVETGLVCESLSRFKSRAETVRVLKGVRDGSINILIGTHRVLQNDVVFKDLGMLIVDEEHRFGVAQKERLRALRTSIDVLSLSATPIPRSLQLALYGTKDLSVIETAPPSRQSIKTEMAQFSIDVIITALRSEVERGGQAFVVQHYIEGLEELKQMICERDSDLRVAIAHGRMPKAGLEKTIHDFYAGQIDVLLSTAIVESGLDVTNANTMVIVYPEDFGLAQLYQLRGRVGRSHVQAYAYLLHKPEHRLTSDAKRRLSSLASNDSLGVGFQLALQDMEIRGAGTLLGKDQSGHVQKVGVETYKRILERAIEQERSKRGGANSLVISDESFSFIETDVHLKGDQLIPEEYVPNVNERLILYQAVVDLADESEVESMFEEFLDRYGEVPEQVQNLLWASCVRNVCRKAGVTKVREAFNGFELIFLEENGFSELLLKNEKFVQVSTVKIFMEDTKVENLITSLLRTGKKVLSSNNRVET